MTKTISKKIRYVDDITDEVIDGIEEVRRLGFNPTETIEMAEKRVA